MIVKDVKRSCLRLLGAVLFSFALWGGLLWYLRKVFGGGHLW